MPVGRSPFGCRIADDDFALYHFDSYFTHSANIGGSQRESESRKEKGPGSLPAPRVRLSENLTSPKKNPDRSGLISWGGRLVGLPRSPTNTDSCSGVCPKLLTSTKKAPARRVEAGLS
jgi:hypothetical protein